MVDIHDAMCSRLLGPWRQLIREATGAHYVFAASPAAMPGVYRVRYGKGLPTIRCHGLNRTTTLALLIDGKTLDQYDGDARGEWEPLTGSAGEVLAGPRAGPPPTTA